MRPPKKLVDHIREGTFRPERHAQLLRGEDLPLEPVLGAGAAASRVWARMRALQVEYRDGSGPDLLREIAHDFSRAANELGDVAKRAGHARAEDAVAGLAELRADWSAE